MFSNDQPSIVRPTLIDVNPAELEHYPFGIRLNKCAESCNVLSSKVYVSKETKDMYAETFNTITNQNEAKEMTEHISCDSKFKLNSTKFNSNQKWKNKTCQCEQ